MVFLDIITTKNIKMKKLIYLLILFITTFSFSQNAFMEFQFEAKRGAQTAILALTDEFWGDAEFKSGGINIQAFNIGNEISTHRIVLYGDPANWGRSDSLSNEDKWAVFSHKLNNHIEKWTHSSSGNVISWVGDNDDYKYAQIYEFKASDPSAFKAAHDMLVNEMSPTLKGEIGFGSYEIGGYKGASHWVVVTAKNWSDLIVTRRNMKELLSKEWEQYYKDRGDVVHIRNYTLNTAKRY